MKYYNSHDKHNYQFVDWTDQGQYRSIRYEDPIQLGIVINYTNDSNDIICNNCKMILSHCTYEAYWNKDERGYYCFNCYEDNLINDYRNKING